MSKITLTVSDIDLSEDTYRVDFHAEGARLEDGEATAAYFVGYYLHELVSDPKVLKAIGAYGRNIVEGMVKDGHDLAPMVEAKVVITIEDEDLNTGRYTPNLVMFGGDPEGKRLPTTAQIVGTYLRSLLDTADFQLACWKFAEAFVAEHDGRTITNIEQAPSNDEAVRAA